MKDNLPPFFRRAKLALPLLMTLLTLPAVASARSATSNVGNWLGEANGQEIEMAVWFDTDPKHSGYVRGYILNRASQCAIGLFGYRTMSRVTTFFSVISDSSLSNYGMDFEIRRIDVDGVNTACSPLQHVSTASRFMFLYEPELEHASLASIGSPPQDENRYNNVVRMMSLQRSTLSPTMAKIIAANPAIDREYGRKTAPSAAVRRVFADPSLDAKTVIPVAEVPCRALIRDQQVRADRQGIVDITSMRETNSRVGVRFKQYAGPIPGGVWSDEYRDSVQDRYVQVDAESVSSPELLNLPGGPDGLRFGEEACVQAQVIDTFLTALEDGMAVASPANAAVAKSLPRIESTNDFYLFDESGIDQIKGLSMTRVHGTTTLFLPGDQSREGEWRPQLQSMKMRAMVKHSATGFIEQDLLSRYQEVSFIHDADLSSETGSDVWVSVDDSREGGVCIRWSEKHFVDNCMERSSAAMHAEQHYYMTADLDAAKAIFRRISPNANTLSAAEMANPARTCAEGQFCDLPGGVYLNAIYAGDFDRIQALDKQVSDLTAGAIGDMLPSTGMTEVEQRVFKRTEQAQANQIMRNLFTNAFVPDSSLSGLAKRYMYRFQTTSRACFEPGHQVIEKEWIIPPSYTPDTDYNGFNIPGEVIPGQRITASYDVNPEFIALCDRVCDAVSPTGVPRSLIAASREISLGLDRVMEENDCASPAVQRFEKNLIALTRQSLSAGPQAPYVQRSGL